MTKLSLRQAADQVGASKSTILRAIQNGRLSAARTDDGRYAIDPAELFRVYGDRIAQQSEEDAGGQGATPAENTQLKAQIDHLQYQIDVLHGRLEELQSEITLARQVQAQTAQSMLYERRRGLLGWLFKRGA